MSTHHRKPFVAFVLLAVAAAVLVGTGRADAVAGHLFESMSSATLRVHGTVPTQGDRAGSGASFDELVAAGGATSRPAGPTRHVAGPVASVRPRRTEPVSRGTERRVLGSARHHDEVSAHGDARRHAHAGRRDDAGHRRPEAREAREGRSARRAEGKAQRSAHKQETAKDKGESRAARGAHPRSPRR